MRSNSFKRYRDLVEVILTAVRWYCRYSPSFRDLHDLIAEHRQFDDFRLTANRNF